MKRAKHQQESKGPFELIEEAFHLLRLAPASTLACYYLGSLPFIMVLLFFWSDMSRSAFAEQRLAAGALGLSLFFFWMKLWQAVFAQGLLARLSGEPAPNWTFLRLWRMGLVQSILQPSGLFLLSAAFAILVPFGWAYAFYQNVTVLGDGEEGDLRQVFQRAWRQARIWPGQNHQVLFLMQPFGLFVFVNLITATLGIPFLLSKLFGVETVFTQSMSAMLNTTFFAAICGLTYLCLDPILKTIYVLRCFYGESLKTGRDLKAELKSLQPPNKLAGVMGLILLLTVVGPCSAYGSPIPTGLCPPAQGCEERATLGRRRQGSTTPTGLRPCPLFPSRRAATLSGLYSLPLLPQGSSFLATLGFVPESLWDSAFLWTSPDPDKEQAGPTRPAWSADALVRASFLSINPVAADVRRLIILPEEIRASSRRLLQFRFPMFADGAKNPRANPVAAESPTAPPPNPRPQPGSSLSPPVLDRSIDEVLHQREFSWRMPREKIREKEDAGKSTLAVFLESILDTLRDWAKTVGHWLDDLFRWLGKYLRPRPSPGGNLGLDWMSAFYGLLWLVAIALVCALVFLLFRVWQSRRPLSDTLAAAAIVPTPDVADENVGADQLPEDGWLKLARELLERGELRLALRAYYLASLAHLAEVNLITIAKFKSNRDYEHELQRRAHAFPEVLGAFGQTVSIFDRVWYGLHEVNLELVTHFAGQVEKIRIT